MLNPLNYKPVKFGSIREMLDLAVRDAGDKEAYLYRDDLGKQQSVTFRQFNAITENLGAALTAMGYGDAHIACIGVNSFEWICAYLTVLKSAGVFVPIDKELPAADKVNLLNDSETKVVFFSSKYESFIRENMAQLPGVACFIGFSLKEDTDGLLSYEKLVERGRRIPKFAYDSLHSRPDDLKLLVYTSGTTGMAKGVMLTEHNLVSSVYYGLQVSQIYDRGLSVLPYHHTYEAVCDILVSLHFHSTLCINRSMRDIVKDLQFYKPSYVYLVPAIAEFMFANIMTNIREQGKEKTFRKGVKLSRALLKVGIDIRHKVFADLHKVFGGRLVKIVCGGAPIRPEIGKFFGDIGIYLVGGYGITECSPLVAVNHERCNTYDTAGCRLPCLEWRIDSPNEEGIGEICVKGDVVMKGYYKAPEKTAEVLKNGWFYTGDYGYINAEDQVVITGRKKNIIVLSNGKNIYPEEIEGYIQNLPFVREVVVSGMKNDKGNENGLQAEIVLVDNATESEKEVLDGVRSVLKELPSYKSVKKVIIRSEPFPKTSSNKIKRQ